MTRHSTMLPRVHAHQQFGKNHAALPENRTSTLRESPSGGTLRADGDLFKASRWKGFQCLEEQECLRSLTVFSDRDACRVLTKAVAADKHRLTIRPVLASKPLLDPA